MVLKTLAYKNVTPRKGWITTEIVNMIEERRKYSNSTEGQKIYRVLRNLVIRKSREA